MFAMSPFSSAPLPAVLLPQNRSLQRGCLLRAAPPKTALSLLVPIIMAQPSTVQRAATDPRFEGGPAVADPGPEQASVRGPLDLSVLIPVMNEEDSISPLFDQIVAAIEPLNLSFEVVFVDDGSTDGSVEAIRGLHERDERAKLVRFRRNFGKAAALTAAYEHSLGNILITMDGDLQDHPAEIPRFLEMLEREDMDLVSGWKKKRHDPLSKTIPSRLFNLVIRRVAGVPLHDTNCGFKAYRREVWDQVSIYGELHRYIPVLASRRGFRIGEIEVEHHARKHGRSKYGWDRLYKGLLDLITVLFITRYTRRPLHLFGGVGLVCGGAGSAICLYLALSWLQGARLSNRPLLLLGVLLIVVGFQVLTTGLIGEMITYKGFRRADSYSIKETLG